VIGSKTSNSTRCLIVSVAFLLYVSMTIPVRAQTMPVGIHVEIDPQKPLSLRVTIRSRAVAPIKLYKSQLPWGSRYSLILVAVTPEGKCLDKELFVDDPSPERASLEPKGSLSGSIDLQRIFKDLNKALSKSDVHLFWAYDAPKELDIDRWSGGWILIPQHTKIDLPK
jgi:hypothetical protein